VDDSPRYIKQGFRQRIWVRFRNELPTKSKATTRPGFLDSQRAAGKETGEQMRCSFRQYPTGVHPPLIKSGHVGL
jgi:hypothetical protein